MNSQHDIVERVIQIHEANGNPRSERNFADSTTMAESREQMSVPQLSAIWTCNPLDPTWESTLRAYLEALRDLHIACELLVVINGTREIPTEFISRALNEFDVQTQIVALHRPCDDSTTIKAGIEHSRGDLLLFLPPYLQVSPEAIGDMLHAVTDGADLVTCWRHPRIDAKWQSLKSIAFNAVTRYLTRISLHDLNAEMRMMRRCVTDHVPIYGDMHRFVPVLASVQGYRITEVKAKHLEERVRKGEYGIGVYIRRIFDLFALFFLCKFTQKPLRFFGFIGSAVFAVGISILAVVIAQRSFGVALSNRPALLLGVVLLVLGVQLVSLGLLGELIIFCHGKHSRHQHAIVIRQPLSDK